MNNHKIVGCLAMVAILGVTSSLSANVKMPAIFGDHMVLQQSINLPVWGSADAGEEVSVTVGGETAKATAGSDGKWLVKLPPLPSGTTPVTMTVAGKNTFTFQDVLIGDVWLCSGQSNMEFGVGITTNGKDEIANANLPLLRLFTVPHVTAIAPMDDIKTDAGHPMIGHWVVCTPESVAKTGTWSGFSAVGYFFGREIQKTTGGPVGLIAAHWGGTPAEDWTSLSGLQKEPMLKNYVDAFDQFNADYPQIVAEYPAKHAAYLAERAKWDQEVGNAYKTTLQEWNDAVAKAKASGQAAPAKPQPATPAPVAPKGPDGGSYPTTPTILYNAMIAPLVPYGLKGVAWYQGESNTGAPGEYQTLFGRMITDWREKWGQGNFPFLFVQISILNIPEPAGSGWSLVREAQLKTLALPATGMAVSIDVGNPANVHYADKQDVGLRLAQAAKHVAYGQDIVYSGPIYDKMQVEGGAIRLSFTQVGGGLIIGNYPTASGLPPKPPTTLLGFVIAGADKKWVSADAKIDGNTVVVSSPQVPNPVAVRYAWASWFRAGNNLYNKEGLPASPFRTDDWQVDISPNPVAAQPASPAPKQ